MSRLTQHCVMRSAYAADQGARLCPAYLLSPASSQEEPTLSHSADAAAPFIPAFANGADLSLDDKPLSADACCPVPAGTSGAPANPLPTPFSIVVGEHGHALLLLLAAHFSTSQADVVSRALSALADQVGIPTLARPIAGIDAGDDDFRDGGK